MRAVLTEAVKGLPLDADELRSAMDREDINDIAHGRIGVATVRGYAREMVRQGPRELVTTVYGVKVQTYDRNKPGGRK